jgi:hypothetical protein
LIREDADGILAPHRQWVALENVGGANCNMALAEGKA